MKQMINPMKWLTWPLLLCALLLTGCSEEDVAEQSNVVRPVKAMKVADATRFTGRWWPGQTKATQEVDLSFRVAGPLIEFPVLIGDEVSQGDILARIDPRDFEVSVRKAEGRLQEAGAALQRAQADYERALRIYKQDPGAISDTAVDSAREARDRARASITTLEAEVDGAKDQLRYTYLKAPFEGRVVATYVENFEDVQAKQAIVRVLDTSRVEMVVNIPESLISLARDAEDIRVRFDPFPDLEIPAKVKEIGAEASETTRTYPVNLIMDQPQDVKILPGMAGRATGKASKNPAAGAAIEIPVAATFSSGESGKTYVWVIDRQTSTVHLREVHMGELTAAGIRILKGLEPGQWIATAGVHYLREGQKVRILEEG